MPATSEPPPGSVTASAPIISPARVGPDEPVDQVGVAAAAMCGSAMPPVNSAAISPLDAPASNIASCSVDASRAGRRPRRRPPRGTRRRAGPARRPSGAARAGSRRRPPTPGGAARPRGARTPRRSPAEPRARAHKQAPPGSCTHAASAATRRAPWPAGRTAWTRRRPGRAGRGSTTLTAAEVGQHVDLDLEVGRLGHQLAHPARADQLGQPGDPGVVRRRVAVVGDPQPDVGVAALVAGAGVHERARAASGG